MRNVLFCPPTYFDVIDVKNPFMQGKAPVYKELAQRQWEAARQAFAAAGCGLKTIEAVPGLEDMVFAANQVFAGVTPVGEKFVVPSNMRHPSRGREVPHFIKYFEAAGYRVINLNLTKGEFLEGGGDLLWSIDEKLIWAGYGFRSSESGVQQFASAMRLLGIEVVTLELCDPRFYHLDTCLAPLTPQAVLIYPGAFTEAALALIRKHAAYVYEVTEEEALGFVCNGVSANGQFITSRMTPNLERALQAEKINPVLVDTSEFEKSGGSVCCLKQFMP